MSIAPREVAEKLRIASRLLGCQTRKELCARFVAADPASSVTPDRLAKWMQGAAVPREGRVYEELARLVGLRHPAAWVAEASAADFTAAAEAARRPDAPPNAPSIVPDHRHFCADYHCLSPAWSPYFAGWLIRGRLRITPGPEGLAATYTEMLAVGPVTFAGAVSVTARNLHFQLREPAAGVSVTLTTHLPAHPASVLCGLMAGTAMVGTDLAPSSSRVVALRLPGRPETGPEGYAEPRLDVVMADLRDLGLRPTPALGRAVLDFLTSRAEGMLDRVAWTEQERLAAIADLVLLRETRFAVAG